ncbi:hypothetical protein KR99_25970 [Ralstonia solanacearum]|nr:hypothetical protein KR99_25970 [Ralstonia solanacearum]
MYWKRMSQRGNLDFLVFGNGDELCRVIEQIAELEWRKFQARMVEITLKTGVFITRITPRFLRLLPCDSRAKIWL